MFSLNVFPLVSEPRCGFSNAVVQIMRMHKVPYESYDVLQDEELRQQIKEFTSWPTIPQVRCNFRQFPLFQILQPYSLRTADLILVFGTQGDNPHWRKTESSIGIRV